MNPFSEFAQKIWANPATPRCPYFRVLALDPGETTGWSFFAREQMEPYSHWTLEDWGQLPTWPMEKTVENFPALVSRLRPDYIIHERYGIYGWKTNDHSWSEVPTLQIIGGMKMIAMMNKIPFSEQTAQAAKHFCTDDNLRKWGLYHQGQKHARDSVRHGAYFILFGQRKSG